MGIFDRFRRKPQPTPIPKPEEVAKPESPSMDDYRQALKLHLMELASKDPKDLEIEQLDPTLSKFLLSTSYRERIAEGDFELGKVRKLEDCSIFGWSFSLTPSILASMTSIIENRALVGGVLEPPASSYPTLYDLEPGARYRVRSAVGIMFDHDDDNRAPGSTVTAVMHMPAGVEFTVATTHIPPRIDFDNGMSLTIYYAHSGLDKKLDVVKVEPEPPYRNDSSENTS